MNAFWYELMWPLGPELAALLVGFAAFNFFGEMYQTPAGARYLATIDRK